MIAPSTRYLPWILGLAILLALPLLRTRLEVPHADDCARPAELLELDRLPGSGAVRERYEKYDDDLRQWTEVELRNDDRGTRLRGALIRSFRPMDLYSRPPARLLGEIEAGRRHVEWVEVEGERVPIQTFFDQTAEQRTMASYVFVYRGKAVEHPLWEQLRGAPDQIWNGTRPLSLLMVAGTIHPQRREAAREAARAWLVHAYRLHHELCAPAEAGPPDRSPDA
jgi:hypothetical protein